MRKRTYYVPLSLVVAEDIVASYKSTLICLCAVLASAVAKPQFGKPAYNYRAQQPVYTQPPQAVVPILAYSNDVSPDGSYSYSYQTGNGISAQEQGYLKNSGIKDQEAETVQGSYSYTAPDGTPITVTYTADENGYQAQGAHLPVAPPIPVEIQRSLDLIAATQRGAPNIPVYKPQPQFFNRPFNRF
ncbi:unnamed protein product [Timema podura]|uniref:Uncharacterized protein n=1 Tax=Timema podura TaxID=61482 RepID=A0ABN7NEX3_TIMPD|nr:unnamed protein product [Timema podura]